MGSDARRGVSAGGQPPVDFVIDYYRMEIVIGTDVLVTFIDGCPHWRQEALIKHVRAAKDEIIKRSEDYVRAASSAAE